MFDVVGFAAKFLLLERTLKVDLHFVGGQKFSFTCSDLTTTKSPSTNRFNNISAEKTRGWPYTFVLDDVSAITAKHGWRFKFYYG